MAKDYDAAVFARNVKARRISLGFETQEKLAKASGFSPAAISSWESQRSIPNAASVAKLSRCLGCSTDELLGLND